jgi:hypothetical protein
MGDGAAARLHEAYRSTACHHEEVLPADRREVVRMAGLLSACQNSACRREGDRSLAYHREAVRMDDPLSVDQSWADLHQVGRSVADRSSDDHREEVRTDDLLSADQSLAGLHQGDQIADDQNLDGHHEAVQTGDPLSVDQSLAGRRQGDQIADDRSSDGHPWADRTVCHQA